MRSIILIIISMTFMVSCGLMEPRVVERRVHLSLDESWLIPCEVIPPPDKTLYTDSSDRVRAILWTKVYSEQVKEIYACRARMEAIREYNNRFKELNPN